MDGTRSALIVASDAYTDPGLRQLRAPASDAQALAAVLQHPEIGGFEVQTLLNQPAYEVNLAVEEFFADRRPDDLLLLHVSCHGVKDEDGELYFATSNTRLRRLGATAVAAEFVNRRMGRTRSRRVVLLLDCCYAGAFERGMTARSGAGVGIEEHFGGRGRAVITASSAMEYAFEGDELADALRASPSVFTSALVEGLETGEADRDQDGLVGLDELYDYVYDRVRAATPNQTPGKWTFGVQGELVIARRARPVTTPAPLPAELQEAIDSPFAGVRAGAVPELARLLRSRHAGLALAARLALERLTDDDSRMVSAAASAVHEAEAKAQREAEAKAQREAEQSATRVGGERAESKPANITMSPPAASPKAARRPTGPAPESQVWRIVRSPSPTPAGLGLSSPQKWLVAGIAAVIVAVLIVIGISHESPAERELKALPAYDMTSPWRLRVSNPTQVYCSTQIKDATGERVEGAGGSGDFIVQVRQSGRFYIEVSGGCSATPVVGAGAARALPVEIPVDGDVLFKASGAITATAGVAADGAFDDCNLYVQDSSDGDYLYGGDIARGSHRIKANAEDGLYYARKYGTCRVRLSS